MVKVEFKHGDKAQIEDYHWKSERKSLEDLLNSYLPHLGPSGSDPNPDLTVAREMVKIFGGKIIEYDQPVFRPNVIY